MLIASQGTSLIGRQDLLALPTPEPTRSFQPIPHHELVGTLIETLGFRHLEVVNDEYAVSKDGMKLFGLIEINNEENGVRLAIGLRNSNNKTMALALTVGFRVTVCSNMMFSGDFTPVLKKHSAKLDIQAVISVAVDTMQRSFDPLRRKIDVWKDHALSDLQAKAILFDGFILGGIPSCKHLAKPAHDLYFEPEHEEFRPRNLWSLQNAITSAFHELDPIPRFQATAALPAFLGEYQ